MNKVTSINLGGNAYQIEEPGFDVLRAYLDNALAKLEGNPDKEEIRKDLEQAIGEKCARFLKPHKTVITKEEIDQIILEMGPVESEDTEPGSEEKKSTESGAPKRLYNIREGAMIGGVANGIGAYFNIDVTLVRIIFIALAVITHGGFIGLYILMMIFIPHAHTDKDRARAYGLPFTAQELINNAKKSYNEFKHDHKDWSKDWKKERKEWKKMMREDRKYTERAYHRGNGHSWLSETLWSIFGVAAWILIISFALWYGYHHNLDIHNFLDAVNSKYFEVSGQHFMN